MNRFDAMEVYVAVVEAGSLSAAAERLNLAKSAVSRRIAELENHLGVQLLTRTTRRQTLTDTGRAYYQQCLRILNDVAELESSIASQTSALKGRLRIAAPLTFGVYHLTQAINEFIARHPAIEFDLDFNDRLIDLVHEGFDVSLRIGSLENSSMIARRLAAIHHVVCASPNYLKTRGRPQHPDELRGHRVIHYSNLPDSSWHYRHGDGTQGTAAVPAKILANNGDFIRCAAVAGHGITMLPTFIVHESIRSGALVPLLTEYRWRGVNAYAIYPPTRHLSLRVRAFIDFLAERFSGTPSWDRDLPGLAFEV
ncbi:LysR family transcriptional regulator [Exilibacterium tricleocarpae]|uniref:LysR family transcriptional regulator n=1 Tax=Exilibacterium tricleocarpae TaxID=2591008 RepID=A0A545TAK3_9GAMM|nr:LysR family transcriptional regulator [Exilibacterium tricleocarpae]TQV74253.1 LysR family transcriptional regulator [Exilibacterium tricleocarpae]